MSQFHSRAHQRKGEPLCQQELTFWQGSMKNLDKDFLWRRKALIIYLQISKHIFTLKDHHPSSTMNIIHIPSTALFEVFVTGLATEVTENKIVVFEVPTDSLPFIPSVEDGSNSFHDHRE
jgi:hypothetical protein